MKFVSITFELRDYLASVFELHTCKPQNGDALWFYSLVTIERKTIFVEKHSWEPLLYLAQKDI